MDKALLVDQKIEAGKALVKALDDLGILVKTAFWLYLSDLGTWRMFVASPRFDKQGPLATYREIQDTIGTLPLGMRSSLTLDDIAVIGASSPLVELWRVAIKTGPHDIADMRFANTSINGSYIDSAVIYRSS